MRTDLRRVGATGQFGAFLAKNEEARDLVRAMLAMRPNEKSWRGLVAVPAGSPVEVVLDAFQAETDIPLEIPLFCFMHFVSGMLLNAGAVIDGPIGRIHPELWTIVLAPSGSGKTFAHSAIEAASPVKSEFPEPASAARFLQALSEHPVSLWFQDEIAQKLKSIEQTGSPLSEVKEYLLRIYDNKKVERSTKKETITVEHPVMGVLGLNTPESFRAALSPESLLDGFAQRFGIVFAEKDPTRKMVDFPIYDRQRIDKACQKAFDALEQIPIHPVYRLPPDATNAFREAFSIMGVGQEGNESFFRRAMFRAFKAAAIYHLILGKSGPDLDAEDVGWGVRLCAMQIQDLTKIVRTDPIAGKTLSALEKAQGKDQDLIERARGMRSRYEAQGKAFNARVLQRNMSGIQSAEEAQRIFELL